MFLHADRSIAPAAAKLYQIDVEYGAGVMAAFSSEDAIDNNQLNAGIAASGREDSSNYSLEALCATTAKFAVLSESHTSTLKCLHCCHLDTSAGKNRDNRDLSFGCHGISWC